MRDPPGPEIEPTSPALAGGFFTTEPPGKPLRQVVRQVTLGSPPRPEAGLCPSHLHLPRAWHVTQFQLMLVSVSFSASISTNDINCPRARWGAWLLVGNCAGDQPRLIQGIRRRDRVGEDQETIA